MSCVNLAQIQEYRIQLGGVFQMGHCGFDDLDEADSVEYELVALFVFSENR